MVASFLIVCLVYDGPAKHPRVDAEEKQYLLSFQFQSQTSKVKWLLYCQTLKEITKYV